jgi:hypothetical protein
MSSQIQIQQDDTLRFRLSAARIVPGTSVRINAKLVALVDSKDTDQDALEARVLEVLSRFIDAKWTISSLARSVDNSGYERVAVDANTRVPPRENYNLSERARAVSSPGLAIQSTEVDYSLEPKVLEQHTEELQDELILVAQKRVQRFAELTGREWRIGDIKFGVQDDNEVEHYSPKGMARKRAMDGGDGFGVAERLVLLAEVSLRASGPR